MIERCRLPRRRRVALRAGLGKTSCLVVRIRHAGEIGLMAIDTVRLESGILIVHVTIIARHRPMRPRKLKTSGAVVK
jgi:hypothetical protein